MLEKDKRAKKVALVAHCLLNQNAKVNGFAFFPAMVGEIIDLLRDHDYGILQLPCPETIYAGTHRWWFVREQYFTPGFTHLVRDLLGPIIDQIKVYQEDGFKVILIALDGSPSCGLRWSGSNPGWGGKPEIPAGDYPVIEAKGAFMSTLIDMIKESNLAMPPMIGAGFDMPNFKVEDVVKELDDFLTECDKQ
jgi:predicted secreted protein